MNTLRPRALLVTGGALLIGILCLASYYGFEQSSSNRLAVTILLILIGIDAQRRYTTHYIRPACLFLLGTAGLYALGGGYSLLLITIVSTLLSTAVLTFLPDHHPKALSLRNQLAVALAFTELVMLCSLLPSTAVLQSALATVVVCGLLEVLRYKSSEWWHIGRPYALIALILFVCDLSSLFIHL